MADLPRSSLNLTLRLRELVVPVGLLPARDKGETVKFRMVHAECGEAIGFGRVCPTHGEVPAEQIVKAWESGGELIEVDADELEAIAPVDSSGIDVFAIVQADSIDPLLVTKAWYLLPGRGRAAREGYAAIEHALGAEQLTALARFVAWGSEHVGAIDGHRYTLIMRELAQHAELRDATPVSELIAEVELSDRTCDLARKLIGRLEVPFDGKLLTNLHQQRVQQLLDAKLRGERITKPAPAEEPAVERETADLDAALEQSIRGVPRSRKARVEQALART